MTKTGVDTNVLFRMVVNDDPAQRAKALAFGEKLNTQNLGFVSLIVLVEFNWSLRSRYGYSKSEVISAMEKLIRARSLTFESHDAVVRALERASRSSVDFADALIAEHNLEQGCSHTVTFDQTAARAIPSMELLT